MRLIAISDTRERVMNKAISVFIGVILLCGIASAEFVEIDNFIGSKIEVLESSQTRTVISLKIGSFEQNPVTIDGQPYLELNLPGEPVMHHKGKPALPYLCRSIIIPDDARMRLNILKSSYIEYESSPVAPSKGHIKRTMNPETVEYTFDDIYQTDKWYPSSQANSREPYILRDLRGTVIEFYPFQYNPATKTVRVYTELEIEVVNDGYSSVNVFDREEPFTKVDPSFDRLYKNHFLNYENGALLYDPVTETGDMLIISANDYLTDMISFKEWKNQKGIRTTLISVSIVGNNAASIADFIQVYYDSTDLAWILLVGDADDVATPYYSGGSSDPSYAKVAGSDDYPDCFIGRFSAESPAHIQTQVDRTINYEKYPQFGESWYNHAAGIASSLGPGHYGEYDDEHMDYIRDDLLGYNFSTVDRIYDPAANPQMVGDSLNLGRSFINYIGHGSITGWGSSDFNNSHINNLTNDYKLPFIFSVACDNGIFDGYTCFGEAWTRATNNTTGNPTGAMAAYMSSISQDWDPPMYAQDEANDLLSSETSLTFGGICYNGSCAMIDIDYSSGVLHYDTWHIFGDPSVWLTTTSPEAMNIIHDEAIVFNAEQLTVNTGTEAALCALYGDGVLYGATYANPSGTAIIDIQELLPVNEVYNITVTAPNKLTYIGEITAIAPSGAYVVYDSYTVNDYSGNNNGMIDFGETVDLGVLLENIGPDDAVSVTATLSTEDSFVTVIDSTETFGDIAGNSGTTYVSDAYRIELSPDTPDAYSIPMHLEITGSSRDTWHSDFVIVSHAPVLEYADFYLDDSAGNGNGILEANETANLSISLINNGSGHAYSVSGVLSENDNYISISDPDGVYGDILGGHEVDNASDVFTISASAGFPHSYSVELNLTLTGDGGYSHTIQFSLKNTESFEQNNGGYTGTGGWQWGEPTSGPGTAYFGEKVWGTVLGDNYNTESDDYLTGPEYHIYSDEAQLEFYHWYEIEDYWDGGNVQISTNGGSSWEVITPVGDYPHGGIYTLGGPGYCNNSGRWLQAVFNIGAYQGQDVMFRWHFVSDEYVEEAGWYIDDVAILNNAVQLPVLSFEPDSITQTLEEGEQIATDMIITNNGNANLIYHLSSQDTWIEPDETYYTVEPQQFDTVSVSLNAQSLEPGVYTGIITINSNDPANETADINVSLTVTSGYQCEYMPGDVNGDLLIIGSDVSYAVNYFRGVGDCPPDSCFNEHNQSWLYVAADVNGDCAFIGSDVTYLVNYFRGISPSPLYCEYLPPPSVTNEISIDEKSNNQSKSVEIYKK